MEFIGDNLHVECSRYPIDALLVRYKWAGTPLARLYGRNHDVGTGMFGVGVKTHSNSLRNIFSLSSNFPRRTLSAESRKGLHSKCLL